MRKYVFAFLVIFLVLASALVAGLLAGGHVAEAMRVVEGIATVLGFMAVVGVFVFIASL